MMDKDTSLTQHFKYGEFFCKGIQPPEDYFDHIQMVAIELEKLRSILNKPIHINSGWRTPQHNKAVGGSKTSKHLQGLAADITVLAFPNDEVGYYAARYTRFNGMGIAKTYTHLDLRDKFTLWYY